MEARTASPAFVVADPTACRDFFVRHFGAHVGFDAGCYISLDFGTPGSGFHFMAPQDGTPPPAAYAGVWLNLEVEDVDATHRRLAGEDLAPRMPLDDHPWGDRGFAVAGPLGLTVYVFSPREPSPEFRKCYLP